MSAAVHPTALVAPGAVLGAGVRVGPFAIIGAHVTLGEGVSVHAHAVVDGHTTVGAGAEIFSFAAVGTRPQDLKYGGEPTQLFIGERTIIREYATLQPGTVSQHGRGRTDVGAGVLVMAYSHVAHDCWVGDGAILANGVQLAGHVHIDAGAVLGGLTGVHQFVRIGRRAMTGAQSRVMKDVPPFMTADGHPARLFGLNTIGLKRAGFSADTIQALKVAYRRIFLRAGSWSEALTEVESSGVSEVRELCTFLRASTRGVTRAPRGTEAEDE